MNWIILGASRGIGFACLKSALADGSSAMACARASLCQPELEASDQLRLMRIDLEIESQWESLLSEISKTLSGETVIVIAAGADSLEEEKASEKENRFNRIYYHQPVELIESIVERKNGYPITIITMGSSAVWHGQANPIYIEAKKQLHEYVRRRAAEVINQNILLCGIAPAAVSGYDNRWARCFKSKPEVWEAVKERQYLKRFQSPDEIAAVIRWIAKERPFTLSGITMNLDGNVTDISGI